MTIRSVEEILARAVAPTSMFKFDVEVFLDYLTFEQAKPLLKPDMTEPAAGWVVRALTREQICTDIAKYMEFAWGKVQDHRGLSAGRSVEKFEAWLWLLGDDEGLRLVQEADYAQYGAPKLAAICKRLELPIPDDEALRRMAEGLPCTSDCDGCGG